MGDSMSIADVAKGFHDVTILASNAAELRRFYARLGFKQVVDRGDELAVFVVGRNELAIHTSAAQPANAVVLSILVDDLAPVQRHAAEMAIRVDGPIALRPGLTGISLLDPNGNKLEFLRPDAGKDMSDRNQSWYARPVFFVADCEKALRFYSVLGFREAWRHDEGGSLVAVQVNRDGAELILNRNAARAGGGRLFCRSNRDR